MRAASAVMLLFALAACDPFGLPSTRALEGGATSMLASARSYEIAGSYEAAGVTWKIDAQLDRSAGEHLVVGDGVDTVEAVLVGGTAYYRGAGFLAGHLKDPRSQGLVKAAGNSWWRGVAAGVPSLPDVTGAAAFRSAFLGPAVATRTDHLSVGGLEAVELSGARADVYIASSSPYELLRVRLKDGVTVDGMTRLDLVFSHVGADFRIAAPANVIDFSDLSTLPPIYSVDSVDTTGCVSPCAVVATVRNLGGSRGAVSPSTVTFTMRDAVSKQAIGSCTATIQPDVGYNQTARVSCSITQPAVNAAVVTATATNPGRG